MQKKGRAEGIRLVRVCRRRLEAEFQGKLHNARIVRSGRAQELIAPAEGVLILPPAVAIEPATHCV